MALSVEEIAGMDDPILRNLWITQRYHELAVQLRDAGMANDATWCAFAVWASKTAGSTIRGQELPSRVREFLVAGDETQGALHRFNRGLEGRLESRLEHGHLVQAVATVNRQVAASIAAGNVLVFSELAPFFTLLVETRTAPARESDDIVTAKFEAAVANLAAQEVDTTKVEEAFMNYRKALSEPAERPVRVLAANILAVSHEQERLQPAIATALNAGVSDALNRVVDQEIIQHIPNDNGRHTVATLAADVGSVLDRAWQTALTEMLLRLETADERLDLHQNVPPLAGVLYPSTLTDLAGTLAEAPFSQWDRTSGVGAPTGAHDWAIIGERMNYIVTLFRSRQSHPALFNPPFSDEQLAVLSDGRLPAEPL